MCKDWFLMMMDMVMLLLLTCCSEGGLRFWFLT